jgi:hypothetical protein
MLRLELAIISKFPNTTRKYITCVKNGGVTVTQTNVLINQFTIRNSTHTDHHLILWEYTNDGGLHINYNVSIKFLLVQIGSDPLSYYIYNRI